MKMRGFFNHKKAQKTQKKTGPFCDSLWLIFFVLLGSAVIPAGAQRKPFSVVEATIPEMQKALREKRVTSREIVAQYLSRIAMYDAKLHATITVNPNGLKEAEQLDIERTRG